MSATPLDFLLGLTLVVALPWWAMRRFQRLRAAVTQGDVQARLRAYRKVLVVQWPFVGVLLVHWMSRGRELADLGFTLPWNTQATGALLIAGAGILLLLLQLRAVRSSPENLESAHEALGELRLLLPRTQRESQWFSAVAITAGVCEEVLYRGYLPWLFALAMPLPAAFGLAVLAFGLGHAYQGMGGMVKTTILGSLMALMTWLSGSLLPAIVLHGAVDLINGRLAYHVLRHVDAKTPGEDPSFP